MLLLCWLTGMQPPALRTVVALAMWGMLKLSGRQWSGWDVWICCLAAILLMDPVAILSQSLWLSAAAVAALIFWYQWFPCPEWQLPPVLRAVVALIHLQLGITLLLMPVQIVVFHGISLTSFIANLFAIPRDIYHGSVDPRRDGYAFKRAVNRGARSMVSCRPVFGFAFLGVKEFARRVDQHC